MMLDYGDHPLVRRASDAVVMWIQDLLLQGNLKSGEKLPSEAEIARSFGVSRGILREAFSVLETKGILLRQPGRGTFIRKISRAQVLGDLKPQKSDANLFLDLLEVRETLEGKAVELAIQKATPEDLANVAHALSFHMSEYTEQFALERDVDFHLSIVLATHNEVLFLVLRNVGTLMKDVREETLMQSGRLEECQREHEEIFEGIQQHDLRRALSALKKHLNQVRKEVMSSKAKEAPQTNVRFVPMIDEA